MHHRLDGQECEQTPGDSKGQGSPACCSSRAAESDTTKRLNNRYRMISEVEGSRPPSTCSVASWGGDCEQGRASASVTVVSGGGGWVEEGYLITGVLQV